MYLTDVRLEYLRDVLEGIRHIKVRCLEQFFDQSVMQKRHAEIAIFSTYCDIRITCSALYFNSGVILSTLLFLLVD